MGTAISVVAPEDRTDALGLVRSLFDDWEGRLSRFRPESELSRLNAADGRPTRVSPLFLEVVRQARAAAEATGGLFDPTLLAQLVAAGYDRTFELVPDERPEIPDPAVRPSPDGAWRSVDVDLRLGTVSLPPGIGLDFGGIAKGMAVDEALAVGVRAGIVPLAVEAGGDIAVAGLPTDSSAWAIAIELPAGSRSVGLSRGALATSSVSRRHWRVGGEARHHLIDPRTGLPAASDVRSASVAASSCRQAEVAAKVALILGSAAGSGWLESLDLTGLIVLHDGTELAVGDWTWAPAEVPA